MSSGPLFCSADFGTDYEIRNDKLNLMDEEEQQQVGDELRRFQSKSTAKPASVESLA